MSLAWGVYVHVPWCRVRCPYCAFDIVTGERPRSEGFTIGVLRDFGMWKSVFPDSPATLYFGGGTPSRVEAHTLGPIIETVEAPSVTAEANPEDLGRSWLADMRAAGVNRISLGVQTLQPHLAKVVGRAHHDARPAIEAVATGGFDSWSADLMFGLPHQTRADLEADLDALLAFDPPHVSIYGLTIEPGTGFHRLHRRRGLAIPDEDDWAWMYDRIVSRLREAGIHRYEVSNFARDGHRSAHNSLYWSGAPYMGLGPSAHGFAPDGRRWENPSYAPWTAGTEPTVERPTPDQAVTDRIVSGLRGVDGVLDLELGPFTIDPRTRGQLVAAGLLAPEPGRLQLTLEGFPVADAVIRALVRSLTPPEPPDGSTL